MLRTVRTNANSCILCLLQAQLTRRVSQSRLTAAPFRHGLQKEKQLFREKIVPHCPHNTQWRRNKFCFIKGQLQKHSIKHGVLPYSWFGNIIKALKYKMLNMC
jgi:hypothetical protein